MITSVRRSQPSRAREQHPLRLEPGRVWTDKLIFKMVKKLRAGGAWTNTCNKFDPAGPFGDYKESGFGPEGGLQRWAAYLNLT